MLLDRAWAEPRTHEGRPSSTHRRVEGLLAPRPPLENACCCATAKGCRRSIGWSHGLQSDGRFTVCRLLVSADSVGSITSESAMDPSDGPKLPANGREIESKQNVSEPELHHRKPRANSKHKHTAQTGRTNPIRLGSSSRKTPATRAASPPRACAGRSPRARATKTAKRLRQT